MKALVLPRYGSPDVLSLQDIDTPAPVPGEVLVKVHATSINDWDWSYVRGKPHIYRLLFGLFKPKFNVPGIEIAGVVESVGAGVTRFAPGGRVYGDLSEAKLGGFAEYVCVPEKDLGRMTPGISFEQAAALPHAGALALQGLIDVGGIRRGERVLINGAGGGVGMIAVRIAKQYGCEVTGVDRGSKLEALKTLGYDHVIDYQTTDFTATGQRYDLILDAKSTRAPSCYLAALNPGGRYVTVGGHLPRLLQILGAGLIRKIFGMKSKHLKILALKPNKGLDEIGKLFEANEINLLIERRQGLAEVPAALTRFGAGEHAGKIVITVN